MQLHEFFRELRQRRVYRVALGYAAAAWVIIQIASTILPAFGGPPWALKILIALVALGFPIALVLAWIFDLTASGIRRTNPGSGRNFTGAWILALAGLLAAALTFASYRGWRPGKTFHLTSDAANPIARAIEEKSIAVLPLENLSEDKENAYFADGIQDDLLSHLAQIKELKVISRTSTLSYRDVARRDLHEIGRQLGVATVLEGSVRRSQNRVLVNVALTDTRDGRQVWGERYDRTLEDALSLQAELATEITAALRARMSPEEKARIALPPTNNAEAYAIYLRAREHHTRPTHLLQDYLDAVDLYRQAIALDPQFCLAHARLSAALAYIYLNYQPTPEIKAEARKQADEALRLRPDSGEGTLARALCLYWTEKDYEGALRELAVTARLRPSDAEIGFFAGAIRRRQGRWQESLAHMREALSRDPRNVLTAREIMVTDCSLRDWDAASRDGDVAVSLTPDVPALRMERNWVDVWKKGDFTALRRDLAAVPSGVDPDGGVTIARWDAALLARDFTGADNILAASPATVTGVFGPVLTRDYLRGCVALARGDNKKARELLEAARVPMEAEAEKYSTDPFRHAQLGLLYAYLGRHDDAIKRAERALAILPEGRDALYGACISGWQALILARAGETERALDLLERLLKTPGPLFAATEASITQSELRLRWQWDPLRKNPRFQKLVTPPEGATDSR